MLAGELERLLSCTFYKGICGCFNLLCRMEADALGSSTREVALTPDKPASRYQNPLFLPRCQAAFNITAYIQPAIELYINVISSYLIRTRI
jgi:hypothetical protein